MPDCGLFLFPQGESPFFFFLDFISFNMFLSSWRDAGLNWFSHGEQVNAGEDCPFFPSLLICIGVIRLEGVDFLLENDNKIKYNENFWQQTSLR